LQFRRNNANVKPISVENIFGESRIIHSISQVFFTLSSAHHYSSFFPIYTMTSVQAQQYVTMTNNKANEPSHVQIITTEILEPSAVQTGHEATATKALRIIEQYGLNYERTGSWDGFETFLPIVVGQVERGEPIKMLLPGFPFKSPNSRDKVLSNLPDLGEELALRHLNGLCENIKAVYEQGAEVHITSDGLVYNGEIDREFFKNND
jgi:hypothetical protein